MKKIFNDIKDFLRGDHFRAGVAIIEIGAWLIAAFSGLAMLVGTPDKVPAVAIIILAAMAWPEVTRCFKVVAEEDEKQP